MHIVNKFAVYMICCKSSRNSHKSTHLAIMYAGQKFSTQFVPDVSEQFSF